jgi:hypothetical protein
LKSVPAESQKVSKPKIKTPGNQIKRRKQEAAEIKRFHEADHGLELVDPRGRKNIEGKPATAMLTEKTREETTDFVERALAAGDIGPLAAC